MRIVRYTSKVQKDWDSFVRSSKNATFLLERGYMDYHADRFEDHSLLFYQDDELLAIMPANLSEGVFYSHQGLTYGGLVLSYKIKASQVLDVFEELTVYAKEVCKASKIVYRAIPAIYHSYPAEEDLYALFRQKALLIERKLSTTISQKRVQSFQTLRKRQVKRATQHELTIKETDSFSSFWEILNDVLMKRHNTFPVHTAEEMDRLKKTFPENIKLYGVYTAQEEMIAGSIVYESEQVAHAQYIAANEEGKKLGGLDLLFHELIHKQYARKPYFDFGISVENNGWLLNEGLQFQKEGFGGRGIVYDTYEIQL